MRMAKPDEKDINAGGDLMSIMQLIDKNYFWKIEGPESLDDLEDDFDPNVHGHLAALYNSLAELLQRAPGFPGRVLGGMCYVICYNKNQFLDPSKDHLALHPDVIEGLKLLADQREGLIPRLVREAHANLAAHIQQSVARHLVEIAHQNKAGS